MVVHTRLVLAYCLGVLVSVALAEVAFAQQPVWEVLKEPGEFIVSLASDKQGNVWVGTEDKGVFRYAPPTNQWTQFTTKDGLGDNNGYAICKDRLGRMWVGLLNHGVSVFNGESWKTYDVLDGPIGERIFDIACSPVDGDVWLATSAGLTRYSEKKDTWTNYTRADGLPEDQINAIAIDRQGTVYVGTQCQGIAIARSSNDFKTWFVVAGPGPDKAPTEATGRGLPSSLVNDLLVSRDGTVYAATCAGLATSKDGGRTWGYLRGRDYPDKVRKRPGGTPAGWQAPTPKEITTLLPDDYITAVVEDDSGAIILATRTDGVAILDQQVGRLEFNMKNSGLSDNFVSAVLSRQGKLYIGGYGGGMRDASLPPTKAPAKPMAPAPVPAGPTPKVPAWPSPASPPDASEVAAILKRLASETSREGADSKKGPLVRIPALFPIEDDWRTQGTWGDRYARHAGVLCAMGGGGNDVICGYNAGKFEWRGWMGRNRTDQKDELRYWVHWQVTDDVRSLQNPVFGRRRQSEWDDHGEAMPMTMIGPHVYGTIKLAPGTFVVSMYLFNKDGHGGMNRMRDYLVSVAPTPMTYERFHLLGRGNDAEALFDQAPYSAHSRVREFWGGVYKRFQLTVPEGSEYYTVRIHRNHSFNTILSSIFVDRLDSPVSQAPAKPPSSNLKGTEKPMEPELPVDILETEPSVQLLRASLLLQERSSPWFALHRRQLMLKVIRLFVAKDAAGECLASRLEKRCLDAGTDGREQAMRLRRDVARCLDAVQCFDRRDQIYFGDRNFQTYAWEKTTRQGRGWEWNGNEFREYVGNRQQNQLW